MLSRKIPLSEALLQQAQAPTPPPKQASAVPPYLQRSNTIGGVPQRAQSPQQRPLSPPMSAGATPTPYRPGSPFRNRATGSGTQPSIASRIQSPAPHTPNTATRRPGENVEVDLVLRALSRDTVHADEPFTIGFTVTVSAPVPPPPAGERRKQRYLTLVVQHVEPPRPNPVPAIAQPPPVVPGSWSPRLPSSGFSTPSPYGTPYRGDFHDSLAQKLLTASPRQAPHDDNSDTDSDGGDGRETARETPGPGARRPTGTTASLPPPYSSLDDPQKKHNVKFLGTSTLLLPPIRLVAPAGADVESTGTEGEGDAPGHDRNTSVSTITTQSEADSELEVLVGGGRALQVIASQDFELQYIPTRSGFHTVGGLRILLVADVLVDADEESLGRHSRSHSVGLDKVRTLREWEQIAEVWVQS